MSIRWLRNVVIDGQKSTVEVQLGDRRIGDKCYTRIFASKPPGSSNEPPAGDEVELWFENVSEERGDIIAQGVDILRRRLAGKNVTYPNGKQYDWQ
jgi:hypothetical protein